MTINEIQDEVIEEFQDFDEWLDKYQYLIDLGNGEEPLPEQYKTEQNLIDGCQSRVWLQCDCVEEGNPAPSASVLCSAPGEQNNTSPSTAVPCSAPGGQSKILIFRAESDALIVKGIVALLIRVLSGHTPKEILDSDLYFIEEIGLKDHLSPTRSNGLLAMVKQMKAYALAYSMK